MPGRLGPPHLGAKGAVAEDPGVSPRGSRLAHMEASDRTAEALEPIGLVPWEGRGSLPFALVYGESLVATASWAMAAAGVPLGA